MNDRDVLCFANAAEMQANMYLYFFTVHRLTLISIKNLPIYPCKKYLLGTNGLEEIFPVFR
jgi:hypothetical protein